MKKLTTILLALLFSGSAWALPIGNPIQASIIRDGTFWEGCCGDFCDPCLSWWEAWSFRVGFYGDYVFNYHMEVDRSGDDSTIHDTEIYTNAAYFALNLWDRLDVFTTLGASHIYITSPRSAFGNANNNWGFIDTETNFSWSVGLRGTLWECGCFGLGIEGQYFYTRPNINFVRSENGDPDYLSEEHLKLQEWQIGIGAAYQIYIASTTAFIPYMGVKWSHVWIDMHNFHSTQAGMTLFDLESERGFGYAIGVTLLGCSKVSVTVEGRFINEKAVYVDGQFRF